MAILIDNLTDNPKQSVRLKIPTRETNPNEYLIIKFQWMVDLEYWTVGYEYHYQNGLKEDKVKYCNGIQLSLCYGLFGDKSIPFDLVIKDNGMDIGGRLINDLSSGRIKVYVVSHSELEEFCQSIRNKTINNTIQLKNSKIKLGGLVRTLSTTIDNKTKAEIQAEIDSLTKEINHIIEKINLPNNLLV